MTGRREAARKRLLFPVSPRRSGRGLLRPAVEMKEPPEPAEAGRGRLNLVNGFSRPLAAKPGDDLLFHCLGNSTIGAVRFHGRVRDGIGWVTDAMATKLCDERVRSSRNRARLDRLAEIHRQPKLSLMVGFSSANRAIRTG